MSGKGTDTMSSMKYCQVTFMKEVKSSDLQPFKDGFKFALTEMVN